MFCTNCGESLNTNTAFCPKCGTQMPKSDSSIPNVTVVSASKQNYKIYAILGIAAVVILMVVVLFSGGQSLSGTWHFGGEFTYTTITFRNGNFTVSSPMEISAAGAVLNNPRYNFLDANTPRRNFVENFHSFGWGVGTVTHRRYALISDGSYVISGNYIELSYTDGTFRRMSFSNARNYIRINNVRFTN